MSQSRHFYLAVIGVCVGLSIGGLIFSELNLSLAGIRQSLNLPLGQVQWIINIYGIVVSSLLIIAGRLGDVIGRKKLFLIALFIFALAMTGMGLAQNIQTLLISQAINGVASAILMPVSQALITNIFPANRRSKAIGLWAGAVGVALGVGPIYGGIVMDTLSWRWVFLLNVPLILVSFLLVLLFVQDSKSDETTPKIDWLGGLFLALGLGAAVTAIVQWEIWSLTATLTLFGVAVLIFTALYFIEKRVPQPILRQDLFLNRAFFLSSLCNGYLLWFIWGAFFLMPLFLQGILHMSPTQAGLMMLMVTLPYSFFSFFNERFYHRFGPKRLIIAGFVALIFSSLIQATLHFSQLSIWLCIAAVAFGLGWGLIWNASATRAISTLPQQHAGIASGTFVTFQEIGATLGLAVTGAIARIPETLYDGFPMGMSVLCVVSVVGLLTTLLMRPDEDVLGRLR